MNKPFHELTIAERAAIDASGMTWGQLAAAHPQPEWCGYPFAVSALGCWSLTSGMVTGRAFCEDCDCVRPNPAGGHDV